MFDIARVTIAVAVVFLATLASVVAVRILNGEINTNGLLRRKGSRAGDEVSPERVQLLISTFVIASMYLQEAIRLRGTGRMPLIPDSWLAAQGASQIVYLGAKAMSFFRAPVVSDVE